MITSKMNRLLFILIILLSKTEFDIHSQSLISKLNVLPTELPELIPFRDSDLWGYSNSSGEIIIQPKYKHVDFFYGELAIAIVEATPQKTNSDFLHYRYLCDVIDRKGNVIKQVDDVIPYNLTRTSVLIEDSITYILDIKGNIKELGPGQAFVTHTESHLITRNTSDPLTSECSLWTINGEFVKMIPCVEAYEQYTLKKHTQLSEDYYPLYEFTDEFSDNQGIFQTSPFINGLAIVSKDQLIGVIDTLGNHVVPFQIFTLFLAFTEGMALVQQNGLYYYLNTSGQKLELPGKLATIQSGLMQEPSQFSNGSVVIFYEDGKGKWILFMSKTGKAKKIDGLVAGSQKAVMLPTGMSYMSFSARAWKKAQTAKCPRFYFDLRKEFSANEKGETLFSSNVPLTRALDYVLGRIESLGLQKHFAQIRRRADYTRAMLPYMDLILYSKSPSDSVTAIAMPPVLDGIKLREHLEKVYALTLMGGQDKLKGKILRIGHMGYITDETLHETTIRMTEGLNDFNYQLDYKKIEQASKEWLAQNKID